MYSIIVKFYLDYHSHFRTHLSVPKLVTCRLLVTSPRFRYRELTQRLSLGLDFDVRRLLGVMEWESGGHWYTVRFLSFYSTCLFSFKLQPNGILPPFFRFNYKWRHLHLPGPASTRLGRRQWSVYPCFSISFQVLGLTMLNTATADGLMVQYYNLNERSSSSIYLIFIVDSKARRRRAAKGTYYDRQSCWWRQQLSHTHRFP